MIHNRANLGINYMYEFGGELLGVMPQLDLYYNFKSEQINFLIGSFPRKDVLDYPLMVLTDTMNYYRPYMEGALNDFERVSNLGSHLADPMLTRLHEVAVCANRELQLRSIL